MTHPVPHRPLSTAPVAGAAVFDVTVMVEATTGSMLAPGTGPVAVPQGSRWDGPALTGCPVASGFVQYSLDDDGEPADALVLMDEPALPDREVRARPVALLRLLHDGLRAETVVCVACGDPRFADVTGLPDLLAWHADTQALAWLLHRLAPWHDWQVCGYEGAAQAEEYLKHAHHCYQRLTGCPD